MTPELPMHLKRIEALPSALDILRYLYQRPNHEAEVDDICDDLNIGDIRFGKAIRRLVTLGYVQMNAHLVYGLTQNGEKASTELDTYDQAMEGVVQEPERAVRKVYVAAPRTLVAGQPATLQIGFPGDARFTHSVDVVLRMETLNSTLAETEDQVIRLGSSQQVVDTDLTPDWFDQMRFKLQVFQLAADGEDLHTCGGMYVDLNVVAEGEPGEVVAFSTDLTFDGI